MFHNALAVVSLALVFAACDTSPHATPRHPNILLIVTDDQGLGDLACNGNPVLDTPHLDALAAESPRVRRFYVSPVCSPTRASLMTGRYNYRTRVVDTWIGRSQMDPDEVTIAETLRDAGYVTGIFGKWHLGDCYPMRPIDQGFETALVHRGGGLAQPSEPPANARRYTDALLLRNGKLVATAGYCTDVYFDAAIEFIDDSLERDAPFFAYVATNAPHGPFHDVPPGPHAKYERADLTSVLTTERVRPDRVARIFAMIDNIDANVGRALAHLETRGIAHNTIVVFLCDNGPTRGRYVAGLRGGKGDVYDGGIRSPLFVRWPGRLSPRTEVEPIAAHVDLMPTLLEAAGVAPPSDRRLDGRSLLPLLEGRDVQWPDRRIFVQSHRGDVPVPEHHFAVVEQRWKLVRASGFSREAPRPEHEFELYDLDADPGETRDLSSSLPDTVNRLRAAYRNWFEDVSTTRTDNWTPPRITLDAEFEPVTVLTRQDWRVRAGSGWGENGVWLLTVPRPTTREVVVRLAEPRAVDRVEIRLDARTVVVDVERGGTEIPLGRHELRPGPCDLEIVCAHGEDRFGPYQVLLR